MKATPKSIMRALATRGRGARVTAAPAADKIVTPCAALASDDMTMIARSRLLRHHRDGVALASSLDTMITSAPYLATRVIHAANLGRESERQAAITLREYAREGCASAPLIGA